MRSTGFIESGYSSQDSIYKESKPIDLPERYMIKDRDAVYNQGSEGSCVSCSISEMYHFYRNFNPNSPSMKFNHLYKMRSNKDIDGMTPREGFEIMKNEGRILSYARIESIDDLMTSIISNGPSLIALPYCNDGDEFWKGTFRNIGHAVAVVGWNELNLIIKNSWGIEYSNGGYIDFPKSMYDLVLESWTIVS